MTIVGKRQMQNQEGLWPVCRIDRVLVCACLLIVAFASLQVLSFPFGRDQGIFATIGAGLLRGQVLYRDLWDVKTPGIFLVFALAESVFGHTMVGPRIIEVVSLLLTSVALVDLGRRWFGDSLVGYLGAAILAILHFQLDFWHTSQPETYGGMLLLWAAWLLSQETERRARRRQLLAGILLGAVALLKPHSFLAAPLLVWGSLKLSSERATRQRIVEYSIVLSGTLAVLSACAVWLVLGGAWRAAIWTWWDFAPGYSLVRGQLTWASFDAGLYSTLVGLVLNLSALIGIGGVLFLAFHEKDAKPRWVFWWLAGQVCVLALGVWLQQKFFKYHYAAALPVASFAAGAGWARLWRVATGRALRYAWVFLCAFVAAYFMRYPVTDLRGTTNERSVLRLKHLLGLARSKRSRAAYEALYVIRKDFDLPNATAVAAWVSRQTAPKETFLLWGCDSIVYWLAQRSPATRYVHNIPQRSHWQADFARKTFMEEVGKREPKVVIVQHGDSIGPVTGEREDSFGSLARFPEFAAYLKLGYNRAVTIGNYDIYTK